MDEDYVFDMDNYDPETEALFSIMSKVQGEQQVLNVDIMGTPHHIISALVNIYRSSEDGRKILSMFMDVVSNQRFEEQTGLNIEDMMKTILDESDEDDDTDDDDLNEEGNGALGR